MLSKRLVSLLLGFCLILAFSTAAAQENLSRTIWLEEEYADSLTVHAGALYLLTDKGLNHVVPATGEIQPIPPQEEDNSLGTIFADGQALYGIDTAEGILLKLSMADGRWQGGNPA